MRVWQRKIFGLLVLSILLVVGLSSFALAENGQLRGMVWLEKTADGVFGGGEGGYENAKITLERLDENGQPQVAINTTSSRTGEYIFPSLPDGVYRLRVQVDEDYRFAAHGLDSAVLPAMGNVSYTPYFSVKEGDVLEKNIGLLKTYASITLVAFEDSNANGGRMQGEPAVRGVMADLLYDYEGETYIIASVTTNKDGEALIRDLSPGMYRMRVHLPENYVAGPMGQKQNTFYNYFMPEGEDTGITPYFSLATKESLGMGIGMVKAGSLTGKIWYDANFNGLWDADEQGLSQAVVTLSSGIMSESRSVNPDSAGVYAFRGLQPGEYTLTFTLPEGMIFTYPGVSMISDTAREASHRVSVQVDVTSSLGAVGAMPAAGASIFFYQDENLNGQFDEGEAPLAGARVSAYQNDQMVEEAVTDETGCGLFRGLRGGDTEIRAELPFGYIFYSSVDGLFNNPDGQSEASATVSLDGTQPDAFFSAAVTMPAQVEGIFFEDTASTGIYGEGGILLPGFTVQAIMQNGQVAAETVTDESGAYKFSSLQPGTYSIRFLLDDVYVASPVSNEEDALGSRIVRQTPDYGETLPFLLNPGQTAANVNGGAFRAGTVDGYVLIDEAYHADLIGLNGVQAILLTPDGLPYSSYAYGVTDESGYFLIKGVLPGEYQVAYVLPERGQFTNPATNEKKVVSDSFSTESGSEIHLSPLYGILTSTLSGTIVHDNAEGEEPFTALLSLINHAESQVFQVHAKEDGSYAFTGLMPGDYTFQVTLPENLVFGQMEGSPIEATGAYKASAEISFAMGDAWENANILASPPVKLSGRAFYDDNLTGDMEEDEYGAEGRTLTLTQNGKFILETQTDENGQFVFESLVPGTYQLSIDMDESEELVKMPQAQRGEEAWMLDASVLWDETVSLPIMRYSSVSGAVWSLDGTTAGVADIPVSLIEENGEIVATVQTDTFGEFLFPGLLPGAYTLSATLPQGYLFARPQDTQNRESYIQGQPDGTPTPVSFFVQMGDDVSGMDIGMGAMGSIGDQVWLDENGNGLQDIGEVGLPGVVIDLYQHGQMIVSVTSDVYGRYLITDVYPGEYEVRCTIPAEVKATKHDDTFPLVNSILPESDDKAPVGTVIVPSGSTNLHCDMGFALRKPGKYPAVMDTIPVKDWRPYSER